MDSACDQGGCLSGFKRHRTVALLKYVSDLVRIYLYSCHQGLFPYYYDILHEGRAVDLNRCIYNQMCDDPRDENKKDPSQPGKCNTGEDDCEDCRLRPVEDLISVHFTVCRKPWHCMAHSQDNIEHWLCRKIHREWFRLRSELEHNWGRNATGTGNWNEYNCYGFCSRHGQKGYQPISRPFLPTFN